MKIKKEFVDLIYNGEKTFEFRNSNYKDGIYKIKDKWFKLVYVWNEIIYFDSESDIKEKLNNFCKIELIEEAWYDREIDVEEFYISIDKHSKEWILENYEYFIETKPTKNSEGEALIYVYKWIEIELKELESV